MLNYWQRSRRPAENNLQSLHNAELGGEDVTKRVMVSGIYMY